MKRFEWVHVIAQTEFEDETKTTRENWYGIVNGEVDVAYEWSTFTDNVNVAQTSMLNDGVWNNLTLKQKWSANSNALSFTTEFSRGLKSAQTSNDKISVIEDIKENNSVYIFSYQYDIEEQNVKNGIDEGLTSVRSVLVVEKKTGKPLESRLHFAYQDGTEILKRRTTFFIEVNVTPPMEKIIAIETVVEKESSGYEWFGEGEGQKISYYKTTYHSESIVVSGQAITSYKALYVYSSTWSGALYTGTPASILQDAGANWYSIQERCDGSILNWFISTTPVMVHGTSNWYKSSGTQYYHYDNCGSYHRLYVNGSHYARYNFVVMSPSPDFSIYYPAP